MSDLPADPLGRLLAHLPALLPTLEAAYKDVHAHPELSMQENRTAGLAAKHLADNGYGRLVKESIDGALVQTSRSGA